MSAVQWDSYVKGDDASFEMFKKTGLVRYLKRVYPRTIHFDAVEGREVRVSCRACHHPEAVLSMATPVRYEVYSVSCNECDAQLVSLENGCVVEYRGGWRQA